MFVGTLAHASESEKIQSRYHEVLTCDQTKALVTEIFLASVLIVIASLALASANGAQLGIFQPFSMIGTTGAYALYGIAGGVIIFDVALLIDQACRQNKQLKEVGAYRAGELDRLQQQLLTQSTPGGADVGRALEKQRLNFDKVLNNELDKRTVESNRQYDQLTAEHDEALQQINKKHAKQTAELRGLLTELETSTQQRIEQLDTTHRNEIATKETNQAKAIESAKQQVQDELSQNMQVLEQKHLQAITNLNGQIQALTTTLQQKNDALKAFDGKDGDALLKEQAKVALAAKTQIENQLTELQKQVQETAKRNVAEIQKLGTEAEAAKGAAVQVVEENYKQQILVLSTKHQAALAEATTEKTQAIEAFQEQLQNLTDKHQAQLKEQSELFASLEKLKNTTEQQNASLKEQAQEASQNHEAALLKIRAESTQQLEVVERSKKEALNQAEAGYKQQLSALGMQKEQLEQQLQEVKVQNENATKAQQKQHAEAQSALQLQMTKLQDQLKELEQKYQTEREEAGKATTAANEQALIQLKTTHQQEIDRLNQQLQNFGTRFQDAEKQHAATIEQLKAEQTAKEKDLSTKLETANQSVQELSQKHALEIQKVTSQAEQAKTQALKELVEKHETQTADWEKQSQNFTAKIAQLSEGTKLVEDYVQVQEQTQVLRQTNEKLGEEKQFLEGLLKKQEQEHNQASTKLINDVRQFQQQAQEAKAAQQRIEESNTQLTGIITDLKAKYAGKEQETPLIETETSHGRARFDTPKAERASTSPKNLSPEPKEKPAEIVQTELKPTKEDSSDKTKSPANPSREASPEPKPGTPEKTSPRDMKKPAEIVQTDPKPTQADSPGTPPKKETSPEPRAATTPLVPKDRPATPLAGQGSSAPTTPTKIVATPQPSPSRPLSPADQRKQMITNIASFSTGQPDAKQYDIRNVKFDFKKPGTFEFGLSELGTTIGKDKEEMVNNLFSNVAGFIEAAGKSSTVQTTFERRAKAIKDTLNILISLPNVKIEQLFSK